MNPRTQSRTRKRQSWRSAQPASEPKTTEPVSPSLPMPATNTNTPNLTHVTPRPLLDPIREVKRESIHWKRKVFHVLGCSSAGLTYALTSVTTLEAIMCLGLVAIFFVPADILRFFVPSLNKRVKEDLGFLMRDYELDGLSGSSWFFLAGIITIAIFPKWPAVLAIQFLAFGDPIASLVGVKWGKTKLPGGKSLEGSLALFGLCTIAGLVILLPLTPLSFATALIISSVTALAAAFAEWLPIKKLDDNFRMPLIAGAVATLMFALLV